jgi:tetratricopeptide (TPR) repeat protein
VSARFRRLAYAFTATLAVAGCVTGAEPEPPRADSYANYLIGRLADLQEDHSAASDRYYHALQRAPADPDLLEGAAAAALAAGDVARARSVAQLAASHHVSAPHADLIRAVDELAAGRWRQARDQLARVRGGAADALTERILLNWTRTAEGRVDDVVAEVNAADAARPYAGLFAFQRAMALDYAGRGEEARAAYDQAEQGGLWIPPAIERHADLLARSGERDQALELVRRRDGRQGNPSLQSAATRIEAGQPIAEPLTPARGAAIGLYGLGTIFLQESASTDGLAALTLATMLDPQLDAARIAFAEAQIGLGHTAAARTALAQVPPHSVYSASAKAMESWALLNEDRGEEAVASARASVEEGGGPRAERALADIYRSLERYGEAEPIYTRLIETQAPEWRLYFSRGVTRERLQRWPEAEADFRRSLELSPDQPDVLNYLGYTLVDRGERLDEALALIQRAVEIRPMSGAIIDSLGWAYYQRGEFEQAAEVLERAVELEPADALLNDHLGDAYWRVDRRIEARFQWRRALSLGPAPTDQARIEAKLADGLPALPRTRSATR